MPSNPISQSNPNAAQAENAVRERVSTVASAVSAFLRPATATSESSQGAAPVAPTFNRSVPAIAVRSATVSLGAFACTQLVPSWTWKRGIAAPPAQV